MTVSYTCPHCHTTTRLELATRQPAPLDVRHICWQNQRRLTRMTPNPQPARSPHP